MASLRTAARLSLLFVPAGIAGVVFAGCSSSSSRDSADATSDYWAHLPTDDDGGDSGADGGGEASITTNVATIRLAHVAPDLPPVDFCWRTAGSTTFTGPVLSRGWMPPQPDGGDAGDAGEDGDGPGADTSPSDGSVWGDGADAQRPDASAPPPDAADDGTMADRAVPDAADAAQPDASTPALAPSVAYGQVTSSLRLPAAGTFDVALVSAGAVTCANPVLAGQVTVDPGKHATIVVMGLLAAPTDGGATGARSLSLVGFTDNGVLDPQSARVRLIHGALGWPEPTPSASSSPLPPLSVDIGGQPVAAEVDPRHVSTASGDPPVDALGYATVNPVSAATTIAFHALEDAGAAETWSASDANLGLTGGSLYTGFIVSRPLGSLALVWCSDVATVASGLPQACEMFDAPFRGD